MKKILLLLTALLALSIAAGCGHKSVDNNSTGNEEYNGDFPTGDQG